MTSKANVEKPVGAAAVLINGSHVQSMPHTYPHVDCTDLKMDPNLVCAPSLGETPHLYGIIL